MLNNNFWKMTWKRRLDRALHPYTSIMIEKGIWVQNNQISHITALHLSNKRLLAHMKLSFEICLWIYIDKTARIRAKSWVFRLPLELSYLIIKIWAVYVGK